METATWILQGILAFIFMFSGMMKASMSEKWLVEHRQTGVAGLPAALIKFIGVTEVLGAIGILLPWYLWILPVLTPISALGFCVIMICAAPIHYRLKELHNVLTNVLIFLAAAFVTLYRSIELLSA